MVEQETRRHVLSQALTGLTSWKFIVTNNMFMLLGHPTVVDGRVNFPTHAEAAYPEILCNQDCIDAETCVGQTRCN